MAEIVGLVASSIAIGELAVKITGGILQLKRLWDEVRDVPETIGEIIKRLEVLVPMVIEMDKDFRTTETSTPSHSAAVLSVSYCRDAISELTSVINTLSHNVESAKRLKRNAAKFKVVLKRDTISKYEEKLNWAIQLLVFAQNQHTIATLKLQPQAIVQCLVSAEMTIQSKINKEKEHEDVSSELYEASMYKRTQVNRIDINANRARQKLRWVKPSFFGYFAYSHSVSGPDYPLGEGVVDYCAQIQFPRWITNRAWEIAFSPRLNMSLRPFSVVSQDATIIRAVETGDLAQMRDLFRQKAASPYDQNVKGESLLWIASICGHFELARELFRINPQFWDDTWRISALFGLQSAILSKTAIDFCISADVFRRESFTGLSDDDFTRLIRHISSAFPLSLPYLLPLISSNHYRLPVSQRLGFTLFIHMLRPDSLRQFLRSDGVIVSEDIQHLQQQGISLVVVAALCSVACQYAYDWRQLRKDTAALTKALSFQQGSLSPLLRQPDSNYPNSGFTGELELSVPIGTALSALVVGFCLCRCLIPDREMERRTCASKLNLVLLEWVEDLHDVGVDLCKYGENEKAIFDNLSLTDHEHYYRIQDLCGHQDLCCHRGLCGHRYFRCRRVGYYGFRNIRLDSFTYGPTPGDWSFVWDFMGETFAGDFWAMIEEGLPLDIPGSWVDEEDEDDAEW